MTVLTSREITVTQILGYTTLIILAGFKLLEVRSEECMTFVLYENKTKV